MGGRTLDLVLPFVTIAGASDTAQDISSTREK